ncbi:hypothetical protein VTK73DRAFT_490 [Phialemonium thermophilum]|uniref:Hemerythrin-like domain-containing protein n=1 Tax=Phialemonium thermophilum TaxID=223376 RepID=A0ABR3VV23_9PEZI
MPSFQFRFLLALPAILLAIALTRSPARMASTPPSSSKPWADSPIKLVSTPQYQTKKTDLFTTGATHMALLHNSILRGYNSIYNQAEHVRDVEKADFIGYGLAWYRFVKSHHDDEEENLFARIEDLLGDKTVFAETHKEHESFLQGLAEFDRYLTSVSTDPLSFSGSELLRIMSSFQAPFETHFHNEITTIAALADHPSAPKEGSPEAAAAAAVFKTWGKTTVSKAGYLDVLPFFLLNLDATFEDGTWAHWPPMPAPIRWGLVNIGGAFHYGWWKFASCDAGGRPRELWALQHGVAKARD